ncbi:unnamed protein product [Clonostachys chloroleuca]|uniref:Uncharacterized protein n=1 Tax=Clonostachys chloroleuca TaxID=1926264 RepID=A0AA35M6D9_9HYPO|nr:unnamed protein product [Clonostachys chloroleuca]
MQYSVIKQALEGVKQPMILDLIAGTKKWTLSFPPGTDPKVSAGLSFSYLGAGTNKMVFRVSQNTQPTTWVLGTQHNPRSSTGAKDIKDEISILNRLAHDGVSVPQPFSASTQESDVLINYELENYESGDAGKVCGFPEEYFDLRTAQNPAGRYLEMNKNAGDLKNWLKAKVLDVFHPNKTQFQHLRTSFDKMKASWDKKYWGDFQVIYDITDGGLIVFDPNNDTTNHKATDEILRQWQDDLNHYTPPQFDAIPN